mmetsp:Transcript_27872/g.65437  ORF Transcript_27872/g.65437 Transcript_27872/m.65437 type:complete len:368 (+) Transcript_27872:92-1195(+)
MLMFKPFALLAACVLGLAAMVTPVAAQCCDCSPVGRRRLLDSFLFPEGRHDEEAQEHLAQRRAQELCTCDGQDGRPSGDVTRSVCCDECPSGDSRRRLEPKSAKTKSPKSPKCKSSKSNGEPERRLSKLRASAEAKEVRFLPVAENRKEELPWATPAADGAELLAADPGIWTLPGFLDEELVDKIKALVDKYGNDLGHYGKCAPQQPEEKKCFQFTPFLAETDQDDSELYLEVRAKINSIWPQFRLRDYFTTMNQKGNTGPVDYHIDGTEARHMPATVIIYLTDSEEGTGGDTVFPLAGESGVSVTPRKGTVLTWLNTHADGMIKEKSTHGVQATTDDSSGRITLTQRFSLSPEEFPEVTGQASSVI